MPRLDTIWVHAMRVHTARDALAGQACDGHDERRPDEDDQVDDETVRTHDGGKLDDAHRRRNKKEQQLAEQKLGAAFDPSDRQQTALQENEHEREADDATGDGEMQCSGEERAQARDEPQNRNLSDGRQQPSQTPTHPQPLCLRRHVTSPTMEETGMHAETEAMPALFVAHGAPTLVTEEHEYAHFLRQDLAHKVPRPKAIALFSAHWEEPSQQVSSAIHPETIYDFYGFPDALYQLQYAAPGDPPLAGQIVHLLAEAGILAAQNPRRGWDHGVWTILKMIYPEADIPVVALSVNPLLGNADHYAIGRALGALRRQGVLIIGSGGTSHNLGRIRFGAATPESWTVQFEEWLERAATAWDVNALFSYQTLAPHAALAVPRAEHFVPFLLAMGSCDDSQRAELLHRSYQMGTLSLCCWKFS